jgi:hypothetical protein
MPAGRVIYYKSSSPPTSFIYNFYLVSYQQEQRNQKYNSIQQKNLFLYKQKIMVKKILLGIVAVLLLVLVGYYFYTQYTYSEGIRAGQLVKFSKKGFVFKTYEGELNLGGINANQGNGAMVVNNMWDFSVVDEAVANDIMKYDGQKITVHYQEKVKALPWQGETRYFVDRVEPIK